jgi:hypothetical protein
LERGRWTLQSLFPYGERLSPEELQGNWQQIFDSGEIEERDLQDYSPPTEGLTMAINQSDILRYEAQASTKRSAELIKEAKAARKQTAFLSHSHKDSRLAKSLQAFLHAHGWEIYIDWEDTTMPDSPTRETAENIQAKIRDLDWFLFLGTQNSMNSRWCLWEIGYADGVKAIDNILIIATTDSAGTHGFEYLQVYRPAHRSSSGRRLSRLQTESNGHQDRRSYTKMTETLKQRRHHGTQSILQLPLQARQLAGVKDSEYRSD